MKNKKIEVKLTARGFGRGEFVDQYGCECSIQDSSANTPCIWLGVNKAEPKVCIPGKGWTPVPFPEDTLFSTRMHLTQEHAKELIILLQKFVDTGSIG